MEKIGLAVCYDTKNFGSQLQVLATLKELENLGYDYEIIRYKKKLSIKLLLQTLPRFLNPYFLKTKFGSNKKITFMNSHPDYAEKIKIRDKRFVNFMNEHFIPKSKIYDGWHDLVKKSNSNYNYFICGSDQLWLPSNLGSHFFTLEFVSKENKRISYATSFGVSEIPWFQKRSTKKYLEKFNSLSVRELKGEEIIKNLTDKDVTQVCDPTLLLETEEWDKVIADKRIINEKYILCYFLGDNFKQREVAEELKKKTGLKIVTIPFLDSFIDGDINFGDMQLFDIDCFDFVNLIRNAEYVLTDSFHGSVFSILNHKQFIIFNRFDNNSTNSRNSRIDSLCSLLELSDRRYKDDIHTQINKPINYDRTDSLLNDMRKRSLSFLKKALNENDR